MQLKIPKDYFDQPNPPRIFLCNISGKRMQELPAYSTSLTAKWNSYSELNFEIDRYYTDIITGETKVHPAFDKAEALRLVLVENMAYFILQDPNTNYGDSDTKSLSAFSLEYATASKYLESFRINTGDVDSAELMYLETIYGEGYGIDEDDRYEVSPLNEYDLYEKYFIKEYSDSESYVFKQKAIANESVYKMYDQSSVEKTLYRLKYPNVRFYWPTKPELSLLHLVFKKIPEWKIGDVDVKLCNKERKFDEDRIAVYDFLMNNMADTFKCVVEWDTLNKKVNFYEEADDGITEDNTIQSRFDTDIYISRDNLASNIDIKYSADDIKTKLKVTGSDDLSIRDVNLGKSYIMNLDFYHNLDWMDDDIYDAYDNYLSSVKKYSADYSKAVSARAAAYNRWNDLMNAVPEGGNVVLINDPFKKLYCVYTPTDTAYCKETLSDSFINSHISDLYWDKNYERKIDKDRIENGKQFVVQGYLLSYNVPTTDFICERYITTGSALDALKKKLTLYHVNDNINRSDTDNILLRLKDKDSNTVTIYVYAEPTIATDYIPGKTYCTKSASSISNYDTYVKANINSKDDLKKYPNTYVTTEDYKIYYEISYVESGIVNNKIYSELNDWIEGKITDEYLIKDKGIDLTGYKVSYIGTLGAYFVLAKDETEPINLEDYGIMLLREKRDTYTKIFQTQTENMYSQEKYQCVVSDTEPMGAIPNGTRWLDISGEKAKLKIHIGGSWVESDITTENQRDYENYQRYLDNYQKLQAVQQVLAEKESLAEYCKNGYVVPNMTVNVDDYPPPIYQNIDRKTLNHRMREIAEAHFSEPNTILTEISFDPTIPLYVFTSSSYGGVDFEKANDSIFFSKATEYDEKLTYYVEVAGEKKLASPQPTSETFDNGQYIYYCFNKNTAYYYRDSDDNYQIANPQPTGETYKQMEYYYVKSNEYTFAVYLSGKTPYVAYLTSVGVQQSKMNYYSQLTDFENSFTEDQWIRLSPLIREDEFNDNNFLLTGYESEEERMSICEELMEEASKELKTISQPSLSFSMSMGNILAIPEFKPLMSQFELGNFIRIELRPEVVKRARLLEASLNFDDLSDFSCSFGNLVTTKSEIDLHAELLKQAVQAGKQVATSASNWQKAVDKSNKLEEDIANGLQDCAINIGRASGQAISWDHTGMHFRKYVEGSTTEFEPEEMAIINNALVATNNNWKTSKAAFGKYIVNGEERWGPLAECITAGYIQGSVIEGGSMVIGGSKGKFVVSEDGSVQILGPDKTPVYASQTSVEILENARRYRIELSYDKSTLFSDIGSECTVTCTIYSWDEDITQTLIDKKVYFEWKRISNDNDTTWNEEHKWNTNHVYTKSNEEQVTLKPNEIIISNADIPKNAQIECQITFDDLILKK